jgi:hypothetical protein
MVSDFARFATIECNWLLRARSAYLFLKDKRRFHLSIAVTHIKAMGISPCTARGHAHQANTVLRYPRFRSLAEALTHAQTPGMFRNDQTSNQS